MKARLLTSRDDDFPSAQTLADFTREHERGGLTLRDAETFQDAIDRGLLVAIVDEDEAVIAMAGILPLDEGKFETGGALVHREMSGFGLQTYLLRARLAAFQAWKLADWDKLYTGALHVTYGAGSRRTLEAVGFAPIPYEEAPRELREECGTCRKPRLEGRICCYQFYRAGPEPLDFTWSPGRVQLPNHLDERILDLDLPEI